jgi:hypothetical protein
VNPLSPLSVSPCAVPPADQPALAIAAAVVEPATVGGVDGEAWSDNSRSARGAKGRLLSLDPMQIQ